MAAVEPDAIGAPEPEALSESEPESEPAAGQEPEAIPESAPAPQPEPEPEFAAELEPMPAREPKHELQPEPVRESEPEQEPAQAGEPEAVASEPAADERAGGQAVDEPATGPDPIDAVLLAVERLSVRVEEMSRLSQRHVEHIDRLHAENQQLRAGELRQAISPLLRALVRHHDNLAKLAEAAGDDGPEADSLRIVRSGLLNVLSMAGVEAYEVAPRERFDPTRHQGVSRAETDDPDLDGTVAQMRRCGFVAEDGRVIRPAEVDVYRVR